MNVLGKITAVAAAISAFGVMGCAHPQHGHVEPVVEETVVIEEPQHVESTIVDCAAKERYMHKECYSK